MPAKKINHKEACINLSCKPTIAKFREIYRLWSKSVQDSLDKKKLIYNLHQLEKILYRMNLYRSAFTKIGTILWLFTDYTQDFISEELLHKNITSTTIRNLCSDLQLKKGVRSLDFKEMYNNFKRKKKKRKNNISNKTEEKIDENNQNISEFSRFEDDIIYIIQNIPNFQIILFENSINKLAKGESKKLDDFINNWLNIANKNKIIEKMLNYIKNFFPDDLNRIEYELKIKKTNDEKIQLLESYLKLEITKIIVGLRRRNVEYEELTSFYEEHKYLDFLDQYSERQSKF